MTSHNYPKVIEQSNNPFLIIYFVEQYPVNIEFISRWISPDGIKLIQLKKIYFITKKFLIRKSG